MIAAVSALVIVGTVLVSGGATGPGANQALAATGDFHPRQLTGKWVGTWKNLTFGSQGSLRANVRFNADTKRMIPAVDFGGMMWGCVDNPAAEVVTLRKGTGPNTWNANGFRVSTDFVEGGTLVMRYVHEDHEITGHGTASDCRPNTTFTMAGKLFPGSFTATVKQDFGTSNGTVKLNVPKQD